MTVHKQKRKFVGWTFGDVRRKGLRKKEDGWIRQFLAKPKDSLIDDAIEETQPEQRVISDEDVA